MPGLPLDISQLSALVEDDGQWLASHWCTAPKNEVDGQLGPIAGSAALAARIHFANVAVGRASAADIDFALAHPTSFAVWAQSASTEAGFKLAEALRMVRARAPRGGVQAALDDALEVRLLGGTDRERLTAWAGLPDRRRKLAVVEPRTTALIAAAIESLSREGCADGELAVRLGDSPQVFRALIPALVGREATLSHARLAAASLDVASVRLASMRSPLAMTARAEALRLVLHANVSVFAPACRAVGRMATEDEALRDQVFAWLTADQPTLRRRALAMLVSMDPRRLPQPGAVTLRLEEALARTDDEWRFSTVGPLLATGLSLHPVIEEWVVGALEGGKGQAAARWAIARGLASSREPPSMTMLASVARAAGNVERELVESTNVAQRLLLLRTQTDLAALLDSAARRPPHVVEAVLLGEVAGRDAATTARRAAKALSTAGAWLETVRTSLRDPAELARVEDALELVCGGTLARIAATAGHEVHAPALPSCSAIVSVALASLDADFAVTRTALRILRDSIDVGLRDENAPMSAGEVFGALNDATSALPAKFVHTHDKNLEEIVQRMALACGTDDPSRAGADGVKRLAGYLALTGDSPQLLGTLRKFDDALDEGALRALASGARHVTSVVAKYGEPDGAALAPMVRAAVGGEAPLVDVLSELDDLRAPLMAPRILPNAVVLDRRERGTPNVGAPLNQEHLLARLHELRERLGTCLADPLVAFGVDVPPDSAGAAVGELGLGRLAQPLALLARRIDALAADGEESARRYEEVALLAAGGMGEALLVRDRITRRLYIQKRAFAGNTPHETAFLRGSLRREWEATRDLYHPNVVTVHAIEERRSVNYLIYEYVVGCDLESFVTARPLDNQEARRVVADVAAGLERIHGSGMVHRDIKPANAMLALDIHTEALPYVFTHGDREASVQRSVIIDFGIGARAGTDPGRQYTPHYASPEQMLGGVPAHASQDVYSLGCMAFQVLTGHVLDTYASADEVYFHRWSRPSVGDPRNATMLTNVGCDAWIPWIAAATHPEPTARASLAALRASVPAP